MSESGRDDAPSWPEPRANPELVGHEAAEQALLSAYRSGRLPHAWLVSGPEGIGKATLAYRFARFLLAEGQSPDLFAGGEAGLAVDPESAVFRRVAALGHADLLALAREPDPRSGKPRTEITVEQVRAVSEFLHLTPAEGGFRIVVVDCADDMNHSAANALLKILEEPPAKAVLLLVSHALGRILPTIRSRCRRLSLQPLGEPEIGRILGRYFPGLGEADRRALIRLAEGSPGRALRLAREGGLDLYREMIGLLAGWPRLDGLALHRFGDRFARAEEAFFTLSSLLSWWIAYMVRARARGGLAGEIVPGEAALMSRLWAAANLDQWVAVWEKIGRLFARGESVNLDRKQVLMSAFLTLEDAAPR